jgi:hypothetical protein
MWNRSGATNSPLSVELGPPSLERSTRDRYDLTSITAVIAFVKSARGSAPAENAEVDAVDVDVVDVDAVDVVGDFTFALPPLFGVDLQAVKSKRPPSTQPVSLIDEFILISP